MFYYWSVKEQWRMDISPRPSLSVESFLRDLSEVSYRHGLAIGDHGEVFVMDEDDYASRYSLSEGDYLRFGQG